MRLTFSLLCDVLARMERDTRPRLDGDLELMQQVRETLAHMERFPQPGNHAVPPELVAAVEAAWAARRACLYPNSKSGKPTKESERAAVEFSCGALAVLQHLYGTSERMPNGIAHWVILMMSGRGPFAK
jgi:hypothetical protein